MFIYCYKKLDIPITERDVQIIFVIHRKIKAILKLTWSLKRQQASSDLSKKNIADDLRITDLKLTKRILWPE